MPGWQIAFYSPCSVTACLFLKREREREEIEDNFQKKQTARPGKTVSEENL